MHESPLEESLAERFKWWWRGLFVDMKAKATQSSSLASAIEALPTADVNLFGALFGILNQARERSAFLYELGMRISGKYEWDMPWIELTEDQKDQLERRWPEQQEHLIVEVGNADRPPRPGWTQRMPISLNLRLNNKTLSAAVLQILDRERKALGIPNPPPNSGMKRRPRSWRPIELLDIQRDGVRVLSTAESSQISKVKKLAKQHGFGYK